MIRPIYFGAGLAVGLMLSQASSTSQDEHWQKRLTIRVYNDEQMGCQYISINGGHWIPRLNSIGLPRCNLPTQE